jgi:hypothetical protein
MGICINTIGLENDKTVHFLSSLKITKTDCITLCIGVLKPGGAHLGSG